MGAVLNEVWPVLPNIVQFRLTSLSLPSIANRSRPVLSISAHLHFHPSEISTDNFDCLAKETISPVVTLTACFNMAEATKSKAGKNSKNFWNTDGFVLSNIN